MISKFSVKENCVFVYIAVAAIASVIIMCSSILEPTIFYSEARAQITSGNNNNTNQNISNSTPGTTSVNGNNNSNIGSDATAVNSNNINSNQNITGSVKLRNIIGNAISSQIKISLVQAATVAEKAVGGNAHAVAANLGQENGFLVYTVWVVDTNYNFHRIVVDAGNGNLLVSQNLSIGRNMLGLGRSPLLSPPSGQMPIP